jgi:hypothetical protein
MKWAWTLLSLLGCSSANREMPSQDYVAALVRSCGLEGRISYKLIPPNKVQLTRLDPNSDAAFMCLMKRLEARGVQLGFEGHEQLN